MDSSAIASLIGPAGASVLLMGAALIMAPTGQWPNAAADKAGAGRWTDKHLYLGFLLLCVGLLAFSGGIVESVLLACGAIVAGAGLVGGKIHNRTMPHPNESDISRKLGNTQIDSGLLRNLELFRPLWLFALMAFFLLAQGHLVVVGLALFVVLWSAGSLGTGRWGAQGLPYAALIVLTALVPVTLLVSTDRGLTLEHIGLYFAQWLAFFGVASWVCSTERVRWAAWVGLAFAGVLALLSPVLILRSPDASGFLSELMIQKNVLAGVVAPFVPLAACLLCVNSGGTAVRRDRAIIALLIAVMMAAVAFSGSRGGTLAMMVGITVVGAALWRPLRYIAGAASVAALVYLPLGGLDLLVKPDPGSDVTVRTEIWSRALQVIRDFPLTGLGIGSFQHVVPSLYPYIVSDPEKVHHAHNLYLQVAAETGLPGLAAFIALVGSAMWIMHSGWSARQKRPGFTAWVALGCLGGTSVVLTHGLLDAVTWTTKPAFLVWALIGLGVGAALTERHNGRPSQV